MDQLNWQAPDDVALLRVDAQEAFGPRGKGLGHPEGDDIVPVLNRLHPHFKKRADTRDRHPAVGHISMASTHNVPPYSEIMTSYARKQHGQTMPWRVHLKLIIYRVFSVAQRMPKFSKAQIKI